MERLWRDIRYAARTLAKNPGFLTVALLSLGLGIGANTAIFSLINAVKLRALPVDQPDQLVLLTDPGSGGIEVETQENGIRNLLSYPEFEQLRAHNNVFAGMFAAQSVASTLNIFTGHSTSRRAGAEESTKAHVQLVTGEFFPVLRVQPILGRAFTPEEDRVPGANPVGVISYGFWQSEFAGARDVIGQTIRLGQGNFRILGVAPPGFHGILVGSDVDVWIPMTMQTQVLPGRDYLKPVDTLWLQVMARFTPGMPLKTAESGINVVFQQSVVNWEQQLPIARDHVGNTRQTILSRTGARGASELRDQFQDPLLLLMAMVGLVLLIACANVRASSPTAWLERDDEGYNL